MHLLELESLIKECLIKLELGKVGKKDIYLELFSESILSFTIQKDGKEYKVTCRIEGGGEINSSVSEIETKIKKCKSIEDLLT